jgi:tRNA(Ile)-lysidine synthase
LRYDWFREILQLPGRPGCPSPNRILTAHHADDNIETMLMNFFRGTGIHGLRGILAKQEKIVRPLLLFRKEEIILFANQQHLAWVEDSSNVSDKYTRNQLRNQVIPLMKSIYPEVEQNLMNNIHRFADIEILYHQSIQRHKEKLIEEKGKEIHIPVLKLKKVSPVVTIVHEIITDYGFTALQVNEVLKLLESETGKFIQSGTHRIIKNRNWLIITPNVTEQAQNILIEKPNSVTPFELGKLHIELLQLPPFTMPLLQTPDSRLPTHKGQTPDLIATLDAADIRFPLLLRKWKAGDYFYPLGMKKKKKLSRFFIDQKLSKTDKENCWVIEMNRKILWVVGQRIDERFKISSSTTQYLLITLKR